MEKNTEETMKNSRDWFSIYAAVKYYLGTGSMCRLFFHEKTLPD